MLISRITEGENSHF